jgi:hypothetical protein
MKKLGRRAVDMLAGIVKEEAVATSQVGQNKKTE